MPPFGNGQLRTYEDLHTNAHQIQQQFIKAGFAVEPGSRLAQCIRLIDGLRGNQTQRWHTFKKGEIYRVALLNKELNEFGIIANTILGKGEAWRPGIVDMLRKGFLAPEDEKDQKPRSIQFELLLASSLIRRGRKVIPAEPPDLIVTERGWEVPIAAKRINKLRRVNERLLEGQRQIRKTGRPAGIIAIEMTRLIYPDGASINAKNEAHGQEIAQGKLNQFMEDNFIAMTDGLDPELIIGFICCQSPLLWCDDQKYPSVLTAAVGRCPWKENHPHAWVLQRLDNTLSGNY